MIDLSNIKNYYIACGYTDLRRGIDGLAQIITLQYGYEIDENSLFLFCGRRTDRIKALWFSGDGFVLLYKRLNNGRFQWPRSKDELKLLTPQSFRWLMEGLSVEQKRVIKKVRNKDPASRKGFEKVVFPISSIRRDVDILTQSHRKASFTALLSFICRLTMALPWTGGGRGAINRILFFCALMGSRIYAKSLPKS